MFREEKLWLSIRWWCFHQMFFHQLISVVLFCAFHKFNINNVRINTNMFSTKQNKTQSRQKLLSIQLWQMWLSHRSFHEISHVLNISLFQNNINIDFVCLVIQRYCRKEKMNVLIFRQQLRAKWDGTPPLCIRNPYNWYLLEVHDLRNMLDTFIGVWKCVEKILEPFWWKKFTVLL